MSDSLIEQLEKSAEKALQSNSVAEGIQHLAKTFSLFSQEAKKLKKAQKDLQQRFIKVSEELQGVSLYLKTLLKNINQGIIFINTQGIITLYNESAENILSYRQKEVLFAPFHSFFLDTHFGFSLQKGLQTGSLQQLRYTNFINKDKHKIEVEVFCKFIHEAEPLHRGILIILQDITEKQQLQLIAHRDDRLKEIGKMAAALAHEIRNPLGGIRGYATLLYRDLEHFGDMKDMAFQIIEGTRTLEKLVTTILRFSKPVEIQTQMEDITSLLKSLQNFIRMDPKCPDNISLEIHIMQDPLFLPIDKDAMKRALLNLLVNAYQSMPQGGKILISLLQRDVSCLLSISDEGEGIPSSDIDKIFSPFFTTKKRGNGLGLSETQKIIQAHHGKIDVYSQLGKGTSFTITLPLRR